MATVATQNSQIEREAIPQVYQPHTLRRLAGRMLSRPAYFCGLWHLLHRTVPTLRGRKLVVVFTFHRVTNDDPEIQHLVTYDRGTASAVFDAQIGQIRNYFDVLTLSQFIEIISGKTAPQSHSCLLTFDDADSEFVTEAFPVLARYGCPAVVFAPTDYVESHRRFWHLRVSNAFHRAAIADWPRIKELTQNFPEPRRHWLDDLNLDTGSRRAQACWRFNIALDALAEPDIEPVLAELEAITGSDYTLGIECMTWEQLRFLQGKGIAVESHGASHGKLGRMTPEAVRRELEESKACLETNLGKTIRAICYPAGSVTGEVAALAAEVGYEIGFTTKRGLLQPPLTGSDRLLLTRFDMRGANRYEAAKFLGSLALR